MSRWIDVPIVGGSYADDTRDWSFQDTVNWLPMRAERPGGRSLAMLRDVPGLRLKSVIGTGPYRGYRDVEGKLFVVSGTKLYQVKTDFTATEIGTIPGTGPVSLTHNQVGLDGGNELVIGTVDSGYVYDTKAGTFSQITDPGFPGLQSADFIGGYIIGIEPQRRYWMHSELADAREWNTTDIYSAEAAPDRLTRVIVVGNEVVAIGERSTEVFVNQPTGNAAFQRATGVSQDKGSVSPHSIVILDNTLWMLGSDGIVYRRDGYNWVRVSHHAMEQDISRCDLERAFAFTYEDRGHAIYYLTFPDGKTWGYDVSQGEWARRESYGFDRWRVNGLVRWDGAWYAGDFANGKLYQVDWDYPGLEDQDEIVCRRTIGVLHDDYNRMAVNAVQVRVSSGLPEAVAEVRSEIPAFPNLAITGDFPDEGWQGDAEDYTYTVTGGVAPYTFDISAGALPGGITQEGTSARFSGKRTTVGPFNWTVRVTDADGRTATVADTTTTKSAEIFTWRKEVTGTANTINAVFVDGSTIAVAGNNDILAYSTNRGVAWTVLSNVHSAANPAYQGIVRYLDKWYAFGYQFSDGYAVVGDASFVFTDLAITFRPHYRTKQNAHVIGAFMYVAEDASAGNVKLRRFDGTTWTQIDTGIAIRAAGEGVQCWCESGGYYLLGTSAGRVLRTQDFVTFGVVFTSAASTTGIDGLAELDGTILLGAADGKMHRSTDHGATFDAGYSDGGTNGGRRVLENGYHFIGHGTWDRVTTSSTGAAASWTERFMTTTGSFFVGYAYRDLAVYGGANGEVLVGDVS